MAQRAVQDQVSAARAPLLHSPRSASTRARCWRTGRHRVLRKEGRTRQVSGHRGYRRPGRRDCLLRGCRGIQTGSRHLSGRAQEAEDRGPRHPLRSATRPTMRPPRGRPASPPSACSVAGSRRRHYGKQVAPMCIRGRPRCSPSSTNRYLRSSEGDRRPMRESPSWNRHWGLMAPRRTAPGCDLPSLVLCSLSDISAGTIPSPVRYPAQGEVGP